MPAQPLSIVSIDDGSEGAMNAARRAELIAKDLGAPVHVLSARQPPHFSPDATRLLVIHVEEGPFEWLLETRAEKWVRTFSIPVLVVKQPAGKDYRRALVAAKLESHAGELIAHASTIAPRAGIEMVHVLSTSHENRLRFADAPEAAIRAYRLGAYRDAYRQMDGLIAATAGDEASAIRTRLASGSAPHRLLELARANNASLIVLGKRPRHWLADLFFDRGIVHRVLTEARCDVLLIPGFNPDLRVPGA